MSRTVTLIPGDSVGPEIAKEVTRIVESSGANIKWDWQESGWLNVVNFLNTILNH